MAASGFFVCSLVVAVDASTACDAGESHNERPTLAQQKTPAKRPGFSMQAMPNLSAILSGREIAAVDTLFEDVLVSP